MNHEAGAVEAVSGAQRPLATLQALAEALGAFGAGQAQAAEHATPTVDAAQAEASPVPDAVPPSNAALAAQAAQGQMTLGQLAAEQATQRSASTDATTTGNLASPAVSVLRHDVAPEGVNTPRLPDLLAVPVTVTALHTPPITAPRTQKAEARHPVAHREGEREGAASQDDAEADTTTALLDVEPGPGEGADPAAPDPQAEQLRAALAQAGRRDAIEELDRGRRLLLVLPQAGTGPQPARVWLLSARRALRHSGRWWPGLAATDSWLPWRVFRDGDPQFGRGLTSRAAGPACRVRLGPQAPRLQDAGTASLEIAERIRFVQGLGGQWSLLLLAAPAGWAP